ncbi:S30AE family protein [Mycobacteroides abscessus subsp. abscessus]|nr:S30AE family protein [Mycobacteroides abscessus subsp. abscessus]
MDITVVARNAEIHPNFREYVEEKVSKITQFYPRAQRVDVELTHERNPRQADTAERIELTVYGKGPIIRAEAQSADRYAAVDIAAGKLYERLRRLRDRVKDHRRRYPRDLAEAEILEAPVVEETVAPEPEAPKPLRSAEDLKVGEAREEQWGDTPIIVRQKVHEAPPMSVDEALDQMMMVGHPFFLFVEVEGPRRPGHHARGAPVCAVSVKYVHSSRGRFHFGQLVRKLMGGFDCPLYKGAGD